jgi:phage terminase small subunit
MTAAKPRPGGVPNKLAEPLEPPEGTDWGPCMKALRSDRHRAFVLALYAIRPGYGANVKAAKMAGFGTDRTTAKGWSVIASCLAHDEKIQAAMREEDQKRIRASAPRAVRALSNLVEDPEHRDHCRAIGMVLDRTHPIETQHTITVNHRIDHDAEAVAQLRMMKRLEVARHKLEEMFGYSGLSRYERMLEEQDGKPGPGMIEGSAVEINPDKR